MIGFGADELRFFHYAIYPLALLILCRWWFGPFRWLSFPTVFTVTWLLLIHAQAVEIYLNEYQNRAFLLSVWLTPILVLLSSALVLRGLGHRMLPLVGDLGSEAGPNRDTAAAWVSPVCTLAVFGLIALYIADIGVRNVAFFFIVARPGSAVDAMLLRISGLESHISPLLTLVYSYARSLILPLYAAIVTALAFSNRISKTHWAVAVGGVSLFSVLTAAKAPLAFTLGGVLIAAYLARPRAAGLGRLAGAFGVAMFLPALIYPLLTGAHGMDALGVAATNLWRRVTYVTSVTGAMYFDGYPHLHPFAGATSNRVLALIANVPFHDTSEWVFYRYVGSSVAGGTANSSFFAAFYTDWGMAGVVGGGILVGVVLAGLQVFFDRRPEHDAISVGFRAATMIGMTQLMMTNFFSCALGRGMLSLPILLAVLEIVSARRRSTPIPVLEGM